MIRRAILVVLTVGGLAIAIAWATSHPAVNRPRLAELDSYVYYRNRQHCYYVTSFRGYLRVGTVRLDHPFELPPAEDEEGWAWLGLRLLPGPSLVESVVRSTGSSRFGGLLYTGTFPFASGAIGGVAVPHWTLCVLLLAYPTVAFIRGPLRLWRRRRTGLCMRCGYDLRGSPERCPECGSER